ncbi:hypothetical protein ABC337_05060 [Arthrobacter sp. 1P04PC]|uniref:hypothetical protein n=1 Tax=unclassified Arthrobacter TaxID=235627 RepID=UPI0039A19200
MSYRFKICELVSGDFLNEYPMTFDGDLSRLLQAYGEGTLSLPLFDEDGAPVNENWAQDILPWRSLILVVDEDDRIVWHGIPYRRPKTLKSMVKYPCRTIEAYLIERYVPTMSFRQQDQTSVIFRQLIAVAGDSIGMEYDCPPSGRLRDHDYADDENARVYDRVNELAALIDGFNWTIDVVWGDDEHTFVRKIARTGYPYLGNRDENPAHFFELGQNVEDFDHDDDWSSGNAATHVVAIGEGEGDSKVMSSPVIDVEREAAGWPRIEVRKSFSNVKEQSTIDSHAMAVAAQLFGGQEVIELKARNPGFGEDFTRLGDFALGDTAHVIIDCPSLTLDKVWPVVGWSLSPENGVYKPVLAQIGG